MFGKLETLGLLSGGFLLGGGLRRANARRGAEFFGKIRGASGGSIFTKKKANAGRIYAKIP